MKRQPVTVAKSRFRSPVLAALDELEGKKPAKQPKATVAAELKASRRAVKTAAAKKGRAK